MVAYNTVRTTAAKQSGLILAWCGNVFGASRRFWGEASRIEIPRGRIWGGGDWGVGIGSDLRAGDDVALVLK